MRRNPVTGHEKASAENVLDHMAAEYWLMLPSALETMISIAERMNVDVEALEKQRGERLDNTHDVSVRDGIATIQARGPMFRYASLFSRVSGATSYQDLATDFASALEDRQVKAIILEINSPGGTVDGMDELSQTIASARGQKPIISYVSHLGASAGYAIASAADEIVVAADSVLGSIGTMATVRRKSADPKSFEVVSTQSPLKNADVETPEGMAELQRTIDALAQVFIERVAMNRGVSIDTVLADFGRGGLFVGDAAVRAGLADRLGSYEALHAELVTATTAARFGLPAPTRTARPAPAARASTPRNEETRMAKEEQKAGDGAVAPPAKDAEKVAAPVAAAAPAAAPAGLTEAQVDARVEQLFTARMKAEGDRVAGIKALAKKGNEKMIEQCVADASCSIESAKARLYDHEAVLAKAKLEALQKDEKHGGKPSSAATPAEGELDARAEGRAMGARVRAMLKPPTSSVASTPNA